MHIRLLALVVSVLAATPAASQINSAFGTAQGAADDSVVGPMTLSFPFAMPNGATVTELFADSNGRVFSDGSEPSDFSESVVDLASGPTQIAVFWHDINPVGGAGLGDVFFNDLGTSALVTWNDVVDFGAPAGSEYTVQLEVFPDGSFVVRSDARVSQLDGLVGSSVGAGATLPSLTDFSNALPFNSGAQGTVYEPWDGSAFVFDLVDCDTTFTPNGVGGYSVTTTCLPGVPRSTPSVVTVQGPACSALGATPLDLTYTPDGSGGYDVALGGSLDGNFASGTDLGLGDDTTGTVFLPFTFAMPGGSMVAGLDVDSNGRLFEISLESSDFSESTAELLGDATAMTCAFWDDLSPSDAGAVWAHVAASGAQSITWDDVPEFGTTNSNTFQVQLFPDGVVSMHFVMMAATDGLVGLSSGNGAIDPGESNLASGPISTGGVPVVYEQFTGDFDAARPQVLPILQNLTNPILGTNFDLVITAAPGSIGDFYLLGNPSSSDLRIIGVPCFLETDGILATISTAPGAGYALIIPVLPDLVGQALNTQGAILDTNAGNPFFVLFTNSIDFSFGDV
ncbi:MAG: hypothetical protein AAF196_21070 [Planctomycetota bacterium]